MTWDYAGLLEKIRDGKSTAKTDESPPPGTEKAPFVSFGSEFLEIENAKRALADTLAGYLRVLEDPATITAEGLPPFPPREIPAPGPEHAKAWAGWWDALERHRGATAESTPDRGNAKAAPRQQGNRMPATVTTGAKTPRQAELFAESAAHREGVFS